MPKLGFSPEQLLQIAPLDFSVDLAIFVGGDLLLSLHEVGD